MRPHPGVLVPFRVRSHLATIEAGRNVRGRCRPSHRQDQVSAWLAGDHRLLPACAAPGESGHPAAPLGAAAPARTPTVARPEELSGPRVPPRTPQPLGASRRLPPRGQLAQAHAERTRGPGPVPTCSSHVLAFCVKRALLVASAPPRTWGPHPARLCGVLRAAPRSPGAGVSASATVLSPGDVPQPRASSARFCYGPAAPGWRVPPRVPGHPAQGPRA